MDSLKTVLVLLAIYIGIPLLIVFIVWFINRVFRLPRLQAQAKEHSRCFTGRLLNPDFKAVEAHFSCALPKRLKELYADKEGVLRSDFEIECVEPGRVEGAWYVSYYMPPDLESVRDAWPQCKKLFAFDDDGSGNSYLIDPRKPNPEVLFFDHEGGGFESVGLSLAEFLSAPRTKPKE